ncbi:MAG: hypothetical protein ACFFAN_15650 [Promethearchaeota archaeon]
MLRDQIVEVGIIVRGFVLTSYKFKKHFKKKDEDQDIAKDLRGSFITAINSFAGQLFKNVALEYFESGNLIFVFKTSQIITELSKIEGGIRSKEPLIIYGLLEKGKKKADKLSKKFLEKIQPILSLFNIRYSNCDFTELDQFKPFKKEIKALFTSKK